MPSKPSASIRQLLNSATKHWRLSRLDAELLLAHALNKPRSWLHTWPEATVSMPDSSHFERLAQRRATGEPLAYLVNTKEFYGLTLRVTPDTLIPRPETETLVETVLDIHQQQPPATVLDLGTGTGAIALALKDQYPSCQVWATEINPDTLAVARDNARRLGLSIHFAHGNWFDALPADAPCFDVIVSNPPYIAPDDQHLPALRHEPQQALVAGANGLADLFHIIDQAPSRLRAGGWLLLEHGFDQGDAVRSRLRARGYQAWETRKDLAGLDRISLACWPGQ